MLVLFSVLSARYASPVVVAMVDGMANQMRVGNRTHPGSVWQRSYSAKMPGRNMSLLMIQTPKIKWAASWQNNKMACAPSEDSDQPGHPPSLIRVFAVRMKKAWVISYSSSAQRRLWSDWADAQADLSLRWAHMPFCWFCHVAAQVYLSSVGQLMKLCTPNLNFVLVEIYCMNL